MTLLLGAVPLGVLAGLLRGGSLANVAAARWRGAMWLVPALVARGVISFVAPQTAGAASAVWSFVSYLLLYGALLALALSNRQFQGARLMALGAISNLIAITAAGGRMPFALGAAVAMSHLPAARFIADPGFGHVAAVHLAGLTYLGDVLPLPGPLASLFSVGDALLALGGAWLVSSAMTRTRSDARTHRTSVPAA